MCKTKVINLYGGSSTGKSTTAAMLYAYFKNKCLEAEMCREFVKTLALRGIPITPMDQYHIMGQEMYHIETLIGTVDVLICDSPLQQGNYYLHKMREDLNFDNLGPMDPMIFDFIIQSEKRDVVFYDFFVQRNEPYQTRGRYQTAEESNEDHKNIKRFIEQPIRNRFLNLHYITGDRDERLKKIVEIVEKE